MKGFKEKGWRRVLRFAAERVFVPGSWSAAGIWRRDEERVGAVGAGTMGATEEMP